MSRESSTIESSDGIKLDTRIFRPRNRQGEEKRAKRGWGIVLVHPYSVLGGSHGLIKGIARGLADRSFTAVTFDMRGFGRSTGRPSLTGSYEVRCEVELDFSVGNSSLVQI
ncbi:hypothetical protein ACSBR1_002066 [Camellia fascicularis]